MPLKMYEEKKDFTFDRIKNVIGVAAGKGGVGKSTVTVSLARAFQKIGLTVGVLDADVYGPSLRRMLPEDVMPGKKGDWIEPARCAGIKMISMAYFRGDGEAAVVRAPIANGVIKQFIHQVDWGELDILLIDFPPGTGDIQLTLAQEARLSGVVMVTTPQELALLDVRKAMSMFDQVGVPILGVVENMSYFSQGDQKSYLFGRGGGSRLAAEGKVPFLGEIPIHSTISESGDHGTSIFDSTGEEVQELILQIAGNVQEQLSQGENGLGHGFEQIDSYTFALTRPDAERMVFRLSDIQKRCPCAGCVDGKPVNSEVKATGIQQVGHYGLKIDFTSGCSSGIYSFESLFQGDLYSI